MGSLFCIVGDVIMSGGGVNLSHQKGGRMTGRNAKVSVLVKLLAVLVSISGTLSLVHGVKPSK